MSVQRYSVNPWPSWMGVMHGDEIMFVFGEALKNFTSQHYSLEDRQLSQQIMTYWTNFAKTRSVHGSMSNRVKYLLNYLESTTEGPEGHLYCQRYTKIHRYTPYGNVEKKNKQTNKKVKNEIKHEDNTNQHTIQRDIYENCILY